MELTPKQQASEAIKVAQTILVTTGQHPSSDQVAAVVALTLVLRKLGKKVTALISDKAPANLDFLPLNQIDKSFSGLRDFIIRVDVSRTEVDKLRYAVENGKLNVYVTPFQGGFAPSDVTYAYGDFHYDLVVVMGVPTRVRVDRALEQNPTLLTNVPIINIDFHRSNENYGAVNLIEPTAASLSEMLVSLSESLQNGIIDETIATAILTGIISSTDRFTAQHTTPKTLTVAAQMMAAGAKQQQVVKGLYRRDNRDNRGDRPGGSRPAAPVAPKPAPVQTTSPQPAPPPSQPAQPVVRTPEPVSEPQSSHDEPASQPDSARPVDELPLISEMIEQPHPYVDGSGSVLADEPAPADSSYVNANSYRS